MAAYRRRTFRVEVWLADGSTADNFFVTAWSQHSVRKWAFARGYESFMIWRYESGTGSLPNQPIIARLDEDKN